MAKACNYTLTLWDKLNRFLEYPELELSNNLAENSMRPVALGRRNWIHIGSAHAGPKIAAILFGGGKLPQTETRSARLYGRGSSRTRRPPDSASAKPYPRCLGYLTVGIFSCPWLSDGNDCRAWRELFAFPRYYQ
jgi:hypothetical protein